jgi:hypothetical protein
MALDGGARDGAFARLRRSGRGGTNTQGYRQRGGNREQSHIMLSKLPYPCRQTDRLRSGCIVAPKVRRQRIAYQK